MRKKMEWNWEILDERTVRAKVIGGWVILHLQQTNAFGEVGKKTDVKIVNSESMCFVADRDHEWTIVAPVSPAEAKPTVKADDFAPK